MRYISILFISIIFGLVTAQFGPPHNKAVLCYGNVNSNVERSPKELAKFEDVDLNLCTHLIIESLNPFSEEAPWETGTSTKDENEYKQVTNLKEKYPHLKVISSLYHGVVTAYSNDTEHCRDFIKNATDFVLRCNLDGLSVTFGYNSVSPLQSDVFDKIVSVLKYLKESFESSNLILISWSSFKENISKDYDYVSLSKYVDLMCFTQVNYDTKTQALKVLHISNLEDRLNNLIKLGVPSTKLIMDLYFMGYQFTETDIFDYRITLVYYEICNFIANGAATEWEKFYDEEAGLTVLKRKSGKGKSDIDDITKIVYESTRSVANRVRIAMKLNLAGVLALPMNVDDFHGKCGIDDDTFDDFDSTKISVNILKRKFPMLRTINQAIILTANETYSATEESLTGIAHQQTFNVLILIFAIFLVLIST